MTNMNELIEHDYLSPVPEHFKPQRRIVVCLDGSKRSNLALQWASEHLNKEHDQLILLTVRTFPYNHNTIDYSKVDEEYKQESRLILSDAIQRLEQQGIHCRAIGLRGDPRSELEIQINTLKPDLVVVGNTGKSALAKVLLGSVSRYLLEHIPFPIVVVR
ncbi:hypothetical protein EDD86DRAFT_230807 [Gorgonomyces haynaldii]|nr:hypothetical protein EDD86DRAFT_230807 [Gorgonomyces haynaldii]